MWQKEQTLAAKEKRRHRLQLFPGRSKSETQVYLDKFWRRLCREAGITGLRVHDLRHSFASTLASAGLSLPIIGALLGIRRRRPRIVTAIC